ncbi:hypothetical protein LIBO111022_12230 [Listeria booriae]|uniref:Uncharacterized protein n=1 Tax=Listeria booriae TaxID=1552123 RepID=A0A099VWR7_9LIST|nr:hypothetical protein [Listeria booriae]KGL37959.1 hypothetical protein EP57_15495 [Listeria booriae]STY45958.1 Uncharacterised protein [Listeria booriae]
MKLGLSKNEAYKLSYTSKSYTRVVDCIKFGLISVTDLRLYSPTETYFDKSWEMDDITLLAKEALVL